MHYLSCAAYPDLVADQKGDSANPSGSGVRDPETFGARDRERFDGGASVESLEIDQRPYVSAKIPPLDVNGVRTMAFGALTWLVALIVLLPFYSTLQDNDRGWWLWTCCAGLGLGIIGVAYCRRRRTQLAKHPEREAETSPLGAAGF